MQSLKDSMAWDERTYGREYDLDVYHIVAVKDFNMGAMENKGAHHCTPLTVTPSSSNMGAIEHKGVHRGNPLNRHTLFIQHGRDGAQRRPSWQPP